MIALQINTNACDGSDVFIIWILWLVGAFILGLIIGWLLKQTSNKNDSGAATTSNQKEDLTKIEGIGPKIQELLYEGGINNYFSLSRTKTERLHQILVDGGPAFYTHKDIAYNWPAQAMLADQGHWDDLKKWQDILKEGV